MPRAHRLTAIFTTLLWLLAGCGNRTDVFPEGIAPLEDNTAEWPEATEADPYPEQLVTRTFAEDRQHRGHSRGYIHQPIDRLWEIWHDPLVVADRRSTTRQRTELDVEEGYELSYAIHYEVDEVITVGWTEVSRGGHLLDDSRAFIVRYQKTEGSAFLALIEGSYIVSPVTDDISRIEMIHHQIVAMSSLENIETVQRDNFDSLVAVGRGDPLPVW